MPIIGIRATNNTEITMTEYDIKLTNGHVLIEGGNGRLLVDTGSPLSFHASGRLILGGQEFSVPTSLMGTGAEYVSENVHDHVSGLVGMDLIDRLDGVRIDVPAGKLTFGCGTDGMRRIPSHTGLGYVFMDMTINGQPVQVILDTGAPVSYVSPSLTEGLTPVDRVTDFNPMVPGGTFETPIFEFPASFAGRDFPMRAGHLPQWMGAAISLLRVKGVVGMEILCRYPVAIVDGSVWV